MLHEMENVIYKYILLIHLVVRFYFQFPINIHKILSNVTLRYKYIQSLTSEQSLNFCIWPRNYKNFIYASANVFYIPVVENRQNALFERLASQLLVLDQKAGPKGQPLLLCDQPIGGWLWNLSGRCLFPVQFCWLSKLKCRSDTFTSSHPSLCIVFVRTSDHLRVDPIWSCISPDRPTQLQKVCQSRDLNIDSSENASAHADGWNYKWNNWKSMSMSPQNNSFLRYNLCVLVEWGWEGE